VAPVFNPAHAGRHHLDLVLAICCFWPNCTAGKRDGRMIKFSCTRSLGEEIYYATLIAENQQQAKEMALAEINEKFQKSGGRIREWSVRVLEPEVEGPARILDCGYREA
jgi:hypothetical protein